MAITLSGSPQALSAGYNPLYFYASSDKVNETNFRYLLNITNVNTSTQLASLKIKPRFGDDLLEVNVAKILDNDLGCFSGDIDFNTDVTGFTNTISSGFEYSVGIGEEYTNSWIFEDTNVLAGWLRLEGFSGSTPPYSVGDAINVVGAAEYFDYDYIYNLTGNTAFHLPTTNPSTLGGGWTVIDIVQDSPFTYQQNGGTFNILSVGSDYIEIDLPYQGNTIGNNTGQAIRNYQYDGLQVITDITVTGTTYYLLLDEPWVDSSPVHSGTSKYNDGRLLSDPDSLTESRHVFNGAVGHSDWINWDSDDYNPAVIGEKFLTTLPDNWTVRLDNDIFLNIWGNQLVNGTSKMVINTYDADSVLIDSLSVNNPNALTAQTEIQNVSIGPRSLSEFTYNAIQNGNFATTDFWTLSSLGGTINISGGTLNYSVTGGGSATATATQSGALTIGCVYDVSLVTSNNDSTSGEIFDGLTSLTLFGINDDGTQTLTFTASTEDFIILLESGAGGTPEVNIDNVIVTSHCPIIDCDVDHYTVHIETSLGITQSEVRTFNVDCTCTKFGSYPLLFKDRLGSFVPFNFTLNNKQKVSVTNRDTYKKFIGSGGANAYTYSTAEHSDMTFNTDLEESWTLNTDWLTEAEATYFEELVTSPVVMMLLNDEYVAVIVTDKRYERVRKINKKNIRYKIDIKFSNNNTIQGG